MPLVAVGIDDSFVEKALSLDEALFEPGLEKETMVTITEGPQPEALIITEPTLLSLSEGQKRRFAQDLEAPTISQYPDLKSHALSRYGALQLVLASSLGTPFGLIDQRDGVVVQDLFPREDLLHRPNSSFGAYEDFDFHNDQAYNLNPLQVPDHVILSCIKNIERGATRVVHLPDVLRQLDKRTIRQLGKARYRFFRGRPDEDLGVRTGPILFEDDLGIKIRIGTDTVPITPQAETAFDELKTAFKAVAKGVTLRAGQTLVFPNKTTPHARDKFKPAQRPEDRRWLLRVFIKSPSI